jgi:hypothetical protein
MSRLYDVFILRQPLPVSPVLLDKPGRAYRLWSRRPRPFDWLRASLLENLALWSFYVIGRIAENDEPWSLWLTIALFVISIKATNRVVNRAARFERLRTKLIRRSSFPYPEAGHAA